MPDKPTITNNDLSKEQIQKAVEEAKQKASGSSAQTDTTPKPQDAPTPTQNTTADVSESTPVDRDETTSPTAPMEASQDKASSPDLEPAQNDTVEVSGSTPVADDDDSTAPTRPDAARRESDGEVGPTQDRPDSGSPRARRPAPKRPPKERFGDIDWSFGLGGRGDEVEKFVDEMIKEEGTQVVNRYVSGPLQDAGKAARESDAFIGEDVPSTVGAGQAAGNLLSATGNIAKSLPAIPSTVLEGVEGTKYLLESTTVAGGKPSVRQRRFNQAGAFAKAVAKQQIEYALENPGTAAAEAIFSAGAGAASFRVIEEASDAGRAIRLSTKDKVDFEDITSEEAARTGELPKFDTDPDAETEKAVAEIEAKAADNPEAVTEKTGGETIFHGTQAKFGTDINVGEGGSELPGLFGSPEASTIALESVPTSFSSPSLKPRLPSLSGKSDRFIGLPGDRVEGIPEGKGGSGYELRDVETEEQVEGGLGRGQAKSRAGDRDDVEVRPDQTTSGYDFLTEQAEAGTAYVRPSGQRTTELESIYAPDSEFEKTGQVGVRVNRKQFPRTDVDIPFSGRTVPLDTYKRADTGDVDAATDSMDGDAGEVVDYGELSDRLERLSSQQEGSLTVGGGLTGLGASAFYPGASSPKGTTGASGGLGTGSSPADSTGAKSPTSPPSAPSGTSGGRGASSPPSSPPTSQPSGGPTSAPSSPPDGSPTMPPGGSSTTPPSGGQSPSPTGPQPSDSGVARFPSTPSSKSPRLDFDIEGDESEDKFDRQFLSIDYQNPWASPGEALFGDSLFGGSGGGDAK